MKKVDNKTNRRVTAGGILSMLLAMVLIWATFTGEACPKTDPTTTTTQKVTTTTKANPLNVSKMVDYARKNHNNWGAQDNYCTTLVKKAVAAGGVSLSYSAGPTGDCTEQFRALEKLGYEVIANPNCKCKVLKAGAVGINQSAKGCSQPSATWVKNNIKTGDLVYYFVNGTNNSRLDHVVVAAVKDGTVYRIQAGPGRNGYDNQNMGGMDRGVIYASQHIKYVVKTSKAPK